MEYKHKKTPSFYELLGLKKNISKSEKCEEYVRKAYLRLVKKYHPDKKSISGFSENPEQDLSEIFEMITIAYEVLSDPIKREEYNRILKMEGEIMDFQDIKEESIKYSKTINPSIQKLSQEDFKKRMIEIDLENGYNRSMNDELSPEEMQTRLKDLINMRDQDDKIRPPQLFNGEMDPKKFNAMFDKHHNNNNNNMAIMEFPDPWDQNNDDYFDYEKYDDNFCKSSTSLYESDDEEFANPENFSNISGVNYYDNHNYIDDNYYEDIRNKILERKEINKEIENMKHDDYLNTTQYTFLDKIGFDNNLSKPTNYLPISNTRSNKRR